MNEDVDPNVITMDALMDLLYGPVDSEREQSVPTPAVPAEGPQLALVKDSQPSHGAG